MVRTLRGVPILLFATPLVSNAVTLHFFHTFDLFSYKHGPFFYGPSPPLYATPELSQARA